MDEETINISDEIIIVTQSVKDRLGTLVEKGDFESVNDLLIDLLDFIDKEMEK